MKYAPTRLVAVPSALLSVVCATGTMLGGNPAAAATLEVVADGVPRHLISAGNPAGKMPSQDGMAVIADFRGFFPVAAKLGDTFTATIRMAVVKARNAGASVVLNGDSHFGFYGGQRRMFLSGPLFKGVVLDRPTPDPVLAGQPFDLARRPRLLERSSLQAAPANGHGPAPVGLPIA